MIGENNIEKKYIFLTIDQTQDELLIRQFANHKTKVKSNNIIIVNTGNCDMQAHSSHVRNFWTDCVVPAKYV